MPPLNPDAFAMLGKMKAKSLSYKLPTKAEWKQPMGNPAAKMYQDSLKVGEWISKPPSGFWFTPQNPHKYHNDTCKSQNEEFDKFYDTMLKAVKTAHTTWKMQAKFSGLKVMAVSAIGKPGCLKGPKLENDIKNLGAQSSWSGNMKKWRDAVAKGVSGCFKKWQDKVMVPGLPWYPAFAAFPSPQAPPMPNVPMPLIACPSAKMTEIVTPDPMKKAMIKALASGMKKKDKDKQYEMLFEAIAVTLAMAFLTWLPAQQVMLVLGKGPIPSFAPPYVPVGPVLGGSNIATPGHLAA